MMIDDATISDFQASVWDYYHNHARHDLPWRVSEADGSFDPYKILVSEIMLQQTQVARVIPKYHEFLARFPSLAALAEAELGDVLRVWNGLGYNRRAKFLHQAAQQIMANPDGEFPRSSIELTKLPGVGVSTAGAVLAYTFNQPAVFLETNIRTVYIYHFFRDQTGIPDKEILEVVSQTLDGEHPREWYWALMDYGSHLKQAEGNLSRHGTSYAKQSKFAGSKRQIRGQVIRVLGVKPLTFDTLAVEIPDPRLQAVVDDLLQEGLITQSGQRLTL